MLDLFAGTGSLGIEALSRGAAWTDFVERNRRQSLDLQDNLTRAGYTHAGKVYRAEVARWLEQPPSDMPSPGAYGLALLDPPYRMGDPAPILRAVWDSGDAGCGGHSGGGAQ